MNTALEVIREYIVYGLDVLRRRWLLLCAPIALAAVIASLAVNFAPATYSTKSLILIQGANRSALGFGAGSGGQAPPVEQVRAIEAWVKSDEILTELLPRILDGERENAELSPGELFVAMRAFRNSLTFQLVGNAALEISLSGAESAGLSNKLEIVLARIMEGLSGPDRSILSAPQFVLLRQGDEVKSFEEALDNDIANAGHTDIAAVKEKLGQLWSATHDPAAHRSSVVPVQTQTDTAALRAAISSDRETVDRLLALYAAHRTAVENLATLQAQSRASGSNYVGIFDSPDNLLIIGRPKDPLVGESSARKLAILAILASILGGGALVVLLELMSGVLKTRGEYERVSGLPVVARLRNCERADTHAS